MLDLHKSDKRITSNRNNEGNCEKKRLTIYKNDDIFRNGGKFKGK